MPACRSARLRTAVESKPGAMSKPSTATPLFDMHCHLGFCKNPAKAAQELARLNIHALSCTILPDEYESQKQTLANFNNVYVAAGLHPWWACEHANTASARNKLNIAIESAPFIGEIGLDFSPKHAGTKNLQVKFFRDIASKCAAIGGKVASVHTVKSASCVLDFLQDTGACNAGANNTFIMHWFSGSNDDLLRAQNLGCYFSVGKKMLTTKRGRAYAAAIPENKLLLETDEPAFAGANFDANKIKTQLQSTLNELAILRKCNAGELALRVSKNSKAILNAASKHHLI